MNTINTLLYQQRSAELSLNITGETGNDRNTNKEYKAYNNEVHEHLVLNMDHIKILSYIRNLTKQFFFTSFST